MNYKLKMKFKTTILQIIFIIRLNYLISFKTTEFKEYLDGIMNLIVFLYRIELATEKNC